MVLQPMNVLPFLQLLPPSKSFHCFVGLLGSICVSLCSSFYDVDYFCFYLRNTLSEFVTLLMLYLYTF